MKAFLFGFGIGIGLGVLFAPMSGQETRDNISERANDLANSARETFDQGRDRVQRGVSAIRNVAGGDVRATGTEGPNL
jgi:gas vesicle protein